MTQPAHDKIISARGLRKTYGGLKAVDGIDLAVQAQECIGILGPNGAGKTTTIKMLSCFLEPSGGILEVLGRDASAAPRFIKRHIGVCPQEDNLDPDLSVAENLRVFARYFDIVGGEARGRAEELLHFMGLHAKRAARIDELSGGMKRRLMIARSLINRPRLLILDEPTTGLDPQSRHQIWERLHRLKSEGTTILLTTHYMDEAAHLCGRLIIMDHGKVVVEGAPKDLVREHIGASVIEVSAAGDGARRFAEEKGLLHEKTSTHLYIHGAEAASLWPEAVRQFGEERCILRMANLEDVFLKLTGRALRDE